MSMTSAQPIPTSASHAAARPFDLDPLKPVLGLGERAVKVGVVLGIIGALLVHGAVGVKAASTLGAVHAFAVLVQAQIRERLHSQIDIDMTEPPPPPPPPEPTPEPEPKEVPTAAPPAPANAPPPPAAAEAGKVLTADPDPNEPVDLTGDGFVSGNGDRFAGGVTAAAGTSKTAVADLRAKPEGVGKAPPPGPVASAAGSNLTRAAAPLGGSWNDCGFPAEADIEGIDTAVVTLTVTVGPDGRAKSVTILKDPGNGFGQATRACAFRKQYAAALDRSGTPITMSTAPFVVRFTR